MRALAAMGEKWGFEFPKGSAQVVEAGVAFVRKFGEEALPRVAKVHFGTTAKILARVNIQGPLRAAKSMIDEDSREAAANENGRRGR